MGRSACVAPRCCQVFDMRSWVLWTASLQTSIICSLCTQSKKHHLFPHGIYPDKGNTFLQSAKEICRHFKVYICQRSKSNTSSSMTELTILKWLCWSKICESPRAHKLSCCLSKSQACQRRDPKKSRSDDQRDAARFTLTQVKDQDHVPWFQAKTAPQRLLWALPLFSCIAPDWRPWAWLGPCFEQWRLPTIRLDCWSVKEKRIQHHHNVPRSAQTARYTYPQKHG